MAAITLGGLVRCSQRDAIESVQAQYSALLQTKVAKRRRDPETGKLIEIPGFDEAVLKKHAGVLGLSCLVGAFPYEVPKWMPDVLCQLASCMSDPAEIQVCILLGPVFFLSHIDLYYSQLCARPSLISDVPIRILGTRTLLNLLKTSCRFSMTC